MKLPDLTVRQAECLMAIAASAPALVSTTAIAAALDIETRVVSSALNAVAGRVESLRVRVAHTRDGWTIYGPAGTLFPLLEHAEKIAVTARVSASMEEIIDDHLWKTNWLKAGVGVLADAV